MQLTKLFHSLDLLTVSMDEEGMFQIGLGEQADHEFAGHV